MLTTHKVRQSKRLASKPRVNYTKYFVESKSTDTSDVSESENELQQEGSISSLEIYNISTTPMCVLKQINTVKKMRLESGKPAAVIPVRRSARIAAKNTDDITEVTNILLDMKIDPTRICNSSIPAAATNVVYERPEFMEPTYTEINTRSDLDYMNKLLTLLLLGIGTTTDMYADIIKIADIIEQYPELVDNANSHDLFKQIGSLISVKFLADEVELRSTRSTEISNAICTLLALN